MRIRLSELRHRLREELALIKAASVEICTSVNCDNSAVTHVSKRAMCIEHARIANAISRQHACVCGLSGCATCNSCCPECLAESSGLGKMTCSTCWQRRQGRLRSIIERCGSVWRFYHGSDV